MKNTTHKSMSFGYVAAAGVLALVAYRIWAKRQNEPSQKPRPSEKIRDGRDRVDEASWESFPASDAPAHY